MGTLARAECIDAPVAFGTSFTIQNWGLIVDAIKAPSVGIPPLELAAALAEDAGFDAAITIIPLPLELAAAFADDATLVPTIGLWPPFYLAAAFGEDAVFAAAITVLCQRRSKIASSGRSKIAARATLDAA